MPKKIKKTGEKAPEALRFLWHEGFFKNWADQTKVTTHLAKRGNNFFPDTLRKALSRAPFLISRKQADALEYIQKKPAISKEVDKIETELFDDVLVKKLGKNFEIEIADLLHNFSKSGNCSAFLLRKILEKLIYITFAKHGLESKLEDKNSPGRIIGLEAMINASAQEKIGGIPLLTSATAQAIRGVKFLGDASAHNPLTNVDMKTIIPQMPFIITAYKELTR
jgi:hypothetical protein